MLQDIFQRASCEQIHMRQKNQNKTKQKINQKTDGEKETERWKVSSFNYLFNMHHIPLGFVSPSHLHIPLLQPQTHTLNVSGGRSL